MKILDIYTEDGNICMKIEGVGNTIILDNSEENLLLVQHFNLKRKYGKI